MSVPVLCYWELRGLAQPIRLLLNYTETEFEDRKLVHGPAPGYDRSCWTDVKFNLGLDFPNLPYYVDGEVKITQSNAILRYIARKNDMVGKTEKEKVRVDMMADEYMDLRNGWIKLCYNPDFENLKDTYLTELPKKLQQFSDFLGNKPWFAGESLTFVDFAMYEMLDQHKYLAPDCLRQMDNLQKFQQRIEGLPKISEFMKSTKFLKAPMNGRMAKFNNL